MPFLSELVAGLPVQGDAENCEITAVTDDSRKVQPGTLFIAIQGNAGDGATYIPQAIAQGAAAVISRPNVNVPQSIPHLTTAQERQVMSQLAARFYAGQPEHIVAITGTDGKTSTAEFFRQLMEADGQKAASLGTLGLSSESVSLEGVPALNTSPHPILLHQTLQQLQAKKCDYVSIEASSHGLDQHRVDGVKLQAAAFTTFTRDHLDYHKTEENYFAAKLRLFSEVLSEGALAVAHHALPHGEMLAKSCQARNQPLLRFGEEGELRLTALERRANGMRVSLDLFGQKIETELPLIGSFQIMNILAALGLAHGCGRDVLQLATYLPQLKPVRGRLEQVTTLHKGQTGIYIDYAHTPAALEKALQELRPHCLGALHVVFGCGGDRDAGKRPLMGKAASEQADHIIITDDNPRSEDPAKIRDAIYAGSNPKKAIKIADRAKAISHAIAQLEPGDILLVAGKGHETYQIIGNQTLDFDDAEVIREFAA